MIDDNTVPRELTFDSEDSLLPGKDEQGTAPTRPRRCTKCHFGLLPKETKCSQCGLTVDQMLTELSRMTSSKQEAFNIPVVARPEPFDWAGGERIVDLAPEVPAMIESMAFSANSQRLLAMGRSGRYVLYSVRNPTAKAISGRSRKLPAIIHALSQLGDDDTCLIGGPNPGFLSQNRSFLALWNLREDREVFRYESRCGDIQQIETHGPQIIVAGAGGWVEVFESGNPLPLQRVRVTRSLFHSERITLSRGGRYVGVAKKRKAAVWDLADHSKVSEFTSVLHRRIGLNPRHRRPVQVAVPSTDGKFLLMGGGNKRRTEFEAMAEQGFLNVIALSSVGAGPGQLNGEAVIWDVATQQMNGYLPGNGMEAFDGIVGAKFIDANRVVLVNDSGHVLFWDRKRDSASIREGNYAYFQKLIVSPNDQFVAVQTSENTLRLLRTPWRKRGEFGETSPEIS